MTNDAVRYYDTYRRTLLDMHIPDWDPQFLSQYEPEKVADLYASANISGVLFYCKSHMGLNYWPVPVGAVHPAARDRDFVGEMLVALRARGIAPGGLPFSDFRQLGGREPSRMGGRAGDHPQRLRCALVQLPLRDRLCQQTGVPRLTKRLRLRRCSNATTLTLYGWTWCSGRPCACARTAGSVSAPRRVKTSLSRSTGPHPPGSATRRPASAGSRK